MRKLIIANWKSNPTDVKSAIKLAKAIDDKNVIITPPSPFLESVGKVLKYSSLGAQNVFWADGPYTGEVSATDLKLMKVKYVIIGHSERRKNLKETDKMINLKIKATLKAGLKAVLCVGEPANIRRKGIKKAKDFVRSQLNKDLKGTHNLLLNPQTGGLNSRLIVAYEPVWAISTFKGAKPDTPEEASLMISFIKKTLSKIKPKVIYGGSVNAGNAKAFLSQRVIDGALIGGMSLKPLEFRRVINDIM